MSIEADSADGADPFEDSPLTPQRLAAVFGAMDVVMFAVVGYFLFEDPIFGGLAGLFVGGGVFLFLPLFLASSESDDGLAELESEADRHPFRSFHRFAAGFSLSAGGLVLLSARMAEQTVLLAVGAGVLAAVVLYIPLAFALPNAEL